jgi:hypothetical protein
VSSKQAHMQNTVVGTNDPKDRKGRLKRLGGSQSDHWNNVLANQTVNALWLAKDAETRQRQYSATAAALSGIEPKDEVEGMIAAQLIAAHNTTMECYRRAMINDQTFESRRENLSQANKLSRTYAVLLDALNHHRGKGQQKVTVEHVHVHSGGQAIVGAVESSRGSATTRRESGNPYDARQLLINLTTGPGARFVPGDEDPQKPGPGTTIKSPAERVRHVVMAIRDAGVMYRSGWPGWCL